MTDENLDEIVQSLFPEEWDDSTYQWVLKMKDYLEILPQVEIHGSGMGADGTSDFSFGSNGETYWVTVKKLPRGPSTKGQ